MKSGVTENRFRRIEGVADQEPLLPQVMGAIRVMQKSPNSKAITPFLQTLAAVARRLAQAAALYA